MTLSWSEFDGVEECSSAGLGASVMFTVCISSSETDSEQFDAPGDGLPCSVVTVSI